MRLFYLILKSYLILTSFGVNSNTFRTYNPELSILLNFRLSCFQISLINTLFQVFYGLFLKLSHGNRGIQRGFQIQEREGVLSVEMVAITHSCPTVHCGTIPVPPIEFIDSCGSASWLMEKHSHPNIFLPGFLAQQAS